MVKQFGMVGAAALFLAACGGGGDDYSQQGDEMTSAPAMSKMAQAEDGN